MSIETDADLAVFFNPSEWGVSAHYRAPNALVGDPGLPCTLLLSSPDQSIAMRHGRPLTRSTIVSFLKSQVGSPVRGGTFVVATGVHAGIRTIMSDPQTDEADRNVWTCTVA